ncbi:MAG: hypothetical protein Q4G24_04275 [Paracoccus sp. (in: a-proteobacteria)]|uniref:calcium-binding protein n=1 Tax=Paracoccus sp. TaxID=267 RepID=UPI0026DEBFD2|nr:hypothetical protein [Paracoccus sp. (in: a-proteobacteria)]MDO5620667.1 hypothetical protein [Paracoccus sp. (in: a-proteobacteria)]
MEYVDFYHKGPLGIAEYTDRYKVSGDRLTDKAWFTNNDMFYLSKTEGTAGADNLTGTVLFGMGGNDVLTAHASRDSLLYGGDGNDLLTAGAAGNDGLYGGAGNDTLVSGSGGDLMNGGEGNDTFIFSENSKGHVTVEDFNQFLGEADRMIFNGQFDDIDDFAAHLTQSNLNVIVDAGDLTITINDITISQLLNSDLIFT